ncbi:MAG: helix-turn-helix transcriptional regulator [Firmicutes bacterium]|nr:helix-turn-helix transcriptional regulator [Bacillota bacterium]
MQLTARQKQIVEIVKSEGPITGEEVASRLDVTRATLRPDLTILTMAGILEAKPRVGYTYIGEGEMEALSYLKELRVGDVKAAPVVVSAGATAYDALVTMMLEDQGTVFVVDENGYLTGVVSRQDLLRLSLGRTDLNNVPVGLIMTRVPQVITVTPEESIFTAAHKLTVHQVEALPVVRKGSGPGGPSDKQELLGRITKSIITKLFSEFGEKIN